MMKISILTSLLWKQKFINVSSQTFQNLLSLSVFHLIPSINNHMISLLPLTFSSQHHSVPPHSRPELSLLQLIQVHDLILELSPLLQSLEHQHVQLWYFVFASADPLLHGHQGFDDQAQLWLDLVKYCLNLLRQILFFLQEVGDFDVLFVLLWL